MFREESDIIHIKQLLFNYSQKLVKSVEQLERGGHVNIYLKILKQFIILLKKT